MNAGAIAETFAGKRVLVTGSTGFKGAWLCEWLLALGVRDLVGIGLAPDTEPALARQLQLQHRIDQRLLDIRDAAALAALVDDYQPQILFHLAAQPLVLRSYQLPVETYATNVMGSVHLLNALRQLRQPCAAVFVTTDKCYQNREWLHGYREEDPLGGHDPYSSSKAACELAIDSFRRSFFADPLGDSPPVAIASARAGNVIGGGDWAADRILPDCIRALIRAEPIPVRNPDATRPWQHVLEPLSGYLLLAAELYRALTALPPIQARCGLAGLCTAFNFGPGLTANRPVGQLVDEVLRHWPGTRVNLAPTHAPHEAGLLNLATDKAFHRLGWQPRWDFATAVAHTVAWYRGAHAAPATVAQLCRQQIAAYTADAVQ